MHIEPIGRETWTFPYQASKILEASKAKFEYHTKRLNFWTNKHGEVSEALRSTMKIDESVSDNTSNMSFYPAGNGVHIDEKKRNELNECSSKIRTHSRLINEHTGWIQVLGTVSPETTLELSHEDWLYFFGDSK